MKKQREESEKLRVAVVGCGKMAGNHFKAISSQKNAQLVAVADPRIDDIALPASVGDDVARYASTLEMLEAVSPDAVHIVTPPSTHVELSLVSLDHGASVFVEKPFTLTLKNAKEILAAARARDLKVSAGHQLLFVRAGRKLAELIDQVGRIVHVESYFSFRTVRRGISPVDQLIDILPHPVYMLQSVLADAAGNDKATVKTISVEATHDGEVRAVLGAGETKGLLVVSLSGRPVDSYIKVTGTNGTLHVDLVRGMVIKNLGPGASIFSALLGPYFQSLQLFLKTTGAIFRLFSDRKRGYPGLPDLVEGFYQSILDGSPDPISGRAIEDTVRICEAIGEKALKSHDSNEIKMKKVLDTAVEKLGPPDSNKESVLVTGGTGFLGNPLVSLLRSSGWPVTVLSRSMPPASRRVPGVQYVDQDVAEPVPPEIMKGIQVVIHAAAETAGGVAEHERNSIQATANMLEAARAAGVSKFIHISSTAVVVPAAERGGNPIDESTTLDHDNPGRGPYVWGKAQSEKAAVEFGQNNKDFNVKVIRLGPLVDFSDFKPPGRLGREIHNLYVGVGSPGSRLSICDVHTAAKVIQIYISLFDEVPDLLNLVEPEAPKRGDLVSRYRKVRSPLKVVWFPFFALSILSPFLILLQRLLLKGRKPIDIKAAFSSENFNTDLAAEVISKDAAGAES